MHASIRIRRSVVFYLLLTVSLVLLLNTTYSQKAVRFESPGDFVVVPHSPSLAPEEFTLEFWLRVRDLGDPNVAGGEQTILDKRSGDNGYNVRLAGSEFPIPVFAFVLPGGVSTTEVIYRDLWNHFAVTQDQDSLKIYHNGELSGGDANTYSFNTDAPLRIGEFLGYPGLSLGLRGDIDELRIWNSARSQEQVQSAMHEKLSGSETGLAGYWDFDTLSNGTIPDLSPNGNDGTLNGNATLIDSDAPVGFIPPPPPIGLRAYGAEHSIVLAWKPTESGVSSYTIYRGDSLDFPVDASNLLATVSAPESTYTDSGVEQGRNYIYRLSAIDSQQHRGQPGRSALSRTLAVQRDYITGVYYYPWYGPDVGGHDWQAAYSRDSFVPRQPPLLGHYSSRDPQVIRQHLEWMNTYGVDFFVSSWWGQNSWEDSTLRDFILPELEDSSLTFTLYYESALLNFDPGGITIDAQKEAQLISDFNYIADTYFSHPRFLTVEGKPVVFLYLSRIYSGEFAQAFAKVRSLLLTAGYDLFLIGDEVGWGTPSATHMQFLDAVSPYIMFGNPDYRGYAIDREYFADLSLQVRQWEEVAHRESIAVIPNVHPGFNNRGGGGSAFVGPRQSQAGAGNTTMLEEYIKVMLPFVDPRLKMIMITSWNEWHEDTQVEPTIVTPATTTDSSPSGHLYTQGYSYEGYGFEVLEVIRQLLASELLVNVDETAGAVPSGFALFQNYPNPFNPTTTMSYALPTAARVRLTIHNVLGQLVETLVNEDMEPGIHTVTWSPDGIGSGMYFSSLSVGEYRAVRKLVFVK